MKKNKLIILSLGALLTLSACAGGEGPTSEETSSSSNVSSSLEGSSSNLPSSLESSSSSEEKTSYSIQVEQVANVTVNVASSAKEGDKVTLTLTYDETAIEVKSVSANNVACEAKGNKTYSFVMPSENVTIRVVTENVIHRYQITNGNEEGVTLTDIDGEVEEGKEVTFGYKTKSGFELNGTVSIRSGSSSIDYTDNHDGTYSFVMPSSEVTITLGTRHRLYKINKDEATKSLISLIKCEFTLDYLDEEATGPSYEDIWGHDNKAEYGRNVIVTLTSNVKEKATGIIVPELNLTLPLENNKNTVSFVMPNKDITIKVTSEANLHPLTLQNSDHITLTLFSKENGVYSPVNSVISQSVYYLKATLNSEDYKIREISYSYLPNFGSEVNGKLETVNSDGYYEINLEEVTLKDESGLTITVTEIQNGKFSEYSFLGTFIVTTIDKNNSAQSWPNTLRTVIDDSGLMKVGSDEYSITSATNKNKGEAVAVKADGTSSFKFYYDGDTLIADASLTNKDQAFTNEVFIGIRMPEEVKNDQYQYVLNYYEGFADRAKIDDDNYLSVFEFRKIVSDSKAYADTDLVKTIVIDGAKNMMFMGNVSLSTAEGTKPFTDSNTSYNVLVDGKVAYALKGTGKYDVKHIVLDEFYGDYSLSDSSEVTLSLDGEGGATYKGESGYKYTVNDNQVTLNGNGKKAVITIDVESKTYTVVSEEALTNELVGCTFTDAGKVSYDYYDDESYWPTTYVCTINLFFKNASVCSLSWSDDGDVIIPEGDYSYEKKGNDVTIHALTRSNQNVDIELTLSTDGTQLKFKTDVSYEEVKGQYLTKSAE